MKVILDNKIQSVDIEVTQEGKISIDIDTGSNESIGSIESHESQESQESPNKKTDKTDKTKEAEEEKLLIQLVKQYIKAKKEKSNSNPYQTVAKETPDSPADSIHEKVEELESHESIESHETLKTQKTKAKETNESNETKEEKRLSLIEYPAFYEGAKNKQRDFEIFYPWFQRVVSNLPKVRNQSVLAVMKYLAHKYRRNMRGFSSLRKVKEEYFLKEINARDSKDIESCFFVDFSKIFGKGSGKFFEKVYFCQGKDFLKVWIHNDSGIFRVTEFKNLTHSADEWNHIISAMMNPRKPSKRERG